MTLAITKVPQIYLYGTIDADAPARFESLMKSGRIPPGTDIYLNSTSGDVNAGIALGRLFRSGVMATHLGTPRPPRNATNVNRTAICEGACAYAYLGGIYRWAPAGSDRIGFSTYSAQQTPPNVAAYLKEMDVDASVLTASAGTSSDPVIRPTADQMLANGLANNGRQNLVATYKYSSGAPFLELKQIDRNGEHRITLLCKQGGAELTTYDTIGDMRARQILSRTARSYFEINQQETLAQDQGATLLDQSIVIQRTYPLADLSRVASAQAMGAWVGDRRGLFRYGFAFEVGGVRKVLTDFYNACTSFAPWSSNKRS
ncbi:hypothetical protein [Dyella sp. 2HG41-7]|uniref:hypothetical protein n=1 Tax=Dyella sp. 2HG41-7 TaxID=2883239 RepID=UPI001F3F8D0E|nr:hypothetical protein [Dyella sp. 2HG41-7]